MSLSSLEALFSSVYPLLRFSVLASTGLSLLLSGLLYFKQSSLIYPRYLPEGARTQVPTPASLGIEHGEEVVLETKDGETLKNYFLRPPGGGKMGRQNITVLFMHGNAGNIGHRLPIARVFSEQMGCSIFLLSYRGYGFSTGRPSEKGLLIDAQTALNHLLSTKGPNEKIFVYGQSLGGALAIQLVSRNQDKVDGMILENTFRSMRTLIPSAFPPAKYLARFCHQIWPSETTIGKIEGVPVLFLSGLKDELVPPSHMKTLYTLCRAEKVWRTLPNGSHNDTVGESGYFEYIFEFLQAVKGGKVGALRAAEDRDFS